MLLNQYFDKVILNCFVHFKLNLCYLMLYLLEINKLNSLLLMILKFLGGLSIRDHNFLFHIIINHYSYFKEEHLYYLYV